MKYLLIACSLFFTFSLYAQKKNKKTDEAASFYLFNKQWAPVSKLDSAAYFMQVVKDNDTTYVCRFYNTYGPMVKQESYRDEQLTIPNGTFLWYNNKGYADTMGTVSNGRKDGYWSYFRDEKLYKRIQYENAKVFEKEDYDADIYIDSTGKQSSLKQKQIADSLYWDSIKLNQKTKPDEVEAKFKPDWNTYIMHNLKTPDRFLKIMDDGKHDVLMIFSIGVDGDIQDISLQKSLEWSADTEVFRLLKDAPKWIPAQQKGKPVIYRQKQKLSFVVNNY